MAVFVGMSLMFCRSSRTRKSASSMARTVSLRSNTGMLQGNLSHDSIGWQCCYLDCSTVAIEIFSSALWAVHFCMERRATRLLIWRVSICEELSLPRHK